MTKYDKYAQQRSMERKPRKIHPIWRGIGCILVIIFPIIAYSMAHLLVNMNADEGWLRVPRELAKAVRIPVPEMSIIVPYLYAKVVLTVLILVLGSGLFVILYAIVYQFLGPSRYGPLDAKPVRSNPKRKKPR